MAQIPKGYQRLEKSERLPRPGAHRVAPADPKETLSVTIRVRRRQDAPPLPDPSKAVGQRKVLSHEAFAAHYGAAKDDIDQVIAFAKEQGLALVEASLPRRTVIVSGTVAQMNRAFGVDLGTYESPTETYRGREDSVNLPPNLIDIVEGVFGLDNRRMARRAAARHLPTPSQKSKPLTPPQVATLYGFPAPFDATGQTIGLLEFGGGYNIGDIQAFFKKLELTTPALTPVGVDGATNSPTSDPDSDIEVALDIDVSGAVAQGAKIAVYFAPWTEQGWVDVVTTAVHPAAGQPTPSVISISWAWPELETIQGLSWTQAAIDAVSVTFEEAASLGITIFVASGDHGSSCGLSGNKAHVGYPGSDPWITSCGGTILKDVSTSSFSEETWQDNNGWATGGGISDVFRTVPPWQANANLPGSVNDGHKGRGIPDVAGNADNASGYDLGVVDGQTTGAVGGTSAVGPLYAGLVALLNAKLAAPAGYLNPILYANPAICRDVNDGISNATGDAPGYKSGPGWDACTGLGSIDGSKLLTALKGAGTKAG
jgi:kumamolisin